MFMKRSFEIEWTAPDIPTETWTGWSSVILLDWFTSGSNESPASKPEVILDDTAEARITSFRPNASIETESWWIEFEISFSVFGSELNSYTQMPLTNVPRPEVVFKVSQKTFLLF